MSENKIKVNSIEELISKIKEWVANRGEISSRHIFESSGEYTSKNGKLTQTRKGGVGVNLESGREKQKFFLETDDNLLEGKDSEEFGRLAWHRIDNKSFRFSELYTKIQQELAEISPTSKPKNPQENQPKPKEPKKNSYSIIARPCSSFDQMKQEIKEFYQQNRAEISQNPEFSHWIDLKSCGFGTENEVAPDGKIISKYVRSCEIALQNHVKNQEIVLNLKEERDENNYHDYLTEIENYWISLGGKVEQKGDYPNLDKHCSQCGEKLPENGFTYGSEGSGEKKQVYCSEECMKKARKGHEDSPKNSDRNNQNKIEKLRQEIKDLENNPSTNNSEDKKKELAKKRKKLDELLEETKKDKAPSSSQSSSSNLAIYLGIGGIALLIGGLFLVKLFRKRKKVVK